MRDVKKSSVAGLRYDDLLAEYRDLKSQISFTQHNNNHTSFDLNPGAYSYGDSINVLSVPQITAGDFSIFTQGGLGGTVLDSTISIISSQPIQAARIRISDHVQGDRLDLRLPSHLAARFTVAWDEGRSELTIQGAGSAEDYENMLEAVQFYNDDRRPLGGVRTMHFSLTNDGGEVSQEAYSHVAIVPSNAIFAPVISVKGYSENPNFLVSDITITDTQGGGLKAATISFLGNIPPDSRLGVSELLGFTPQWIEDAQGARLVVRDSQLGLRTASDFEAVLRTLKFISSVYNPGPLTIGYQIENATGGLSSKDVSYFSHFPPGASHGAAHIWASTNAVHVLGGMPTILDSDVQVWDTTHTAWSEVRLTIVGGYQQGRDRLIADVSDLGLQSSFDSATGMLRIFSSTAAALDVFERAIERVYFDTTGSAGLRRVQYQALDPAGRQGASPIMDVDVRFNAKPVVDWADSITGRVGGLVPLGPIDISDGDGTTVREFEAWISNWQPYDRLSWTDPSGFDVTYNTATGLLRVRAAEGGDSSHGAFERFLSGLQFSTATTVPGERILLSRVHDGFQWSNVERTTINLLAIPVPVVTPIPSGQIFVEDQGQPSRIFSDIAFHDGEEAYPSARISIVGGEQPGFDRLTWDAALVPRGVYVVYDGGQGALKISGWASASDYERLIESIGFVTTSQNPGSERAFAITVQGGGGTWSNPSTVRMAVQSMNDIAQIDLGGNSTVWQPGMNSVLIAPNAHITDIDTDLRAGGDLLNEVTIRIRTEGGYESGDRLSINAEAFGLVMTEKSRDESGVTYWLRERGWSNMTIEAYQSALQTLRYDNNEGRSGATIKAIEVQALDERGGLSNWAYAGVGITAPAQIQDFDSLDSFVLRYGRTSQFRLDHDGQVSIVDREIQSGRAGARIEKITIDLNGLDGTLSVGTLRTGYGVTGNNSQRLTIENLWDITGEASRTDMAAMLANIQLRLPGLQTGNYEVVTTIWDETGAATPTRFGFNTEWLDF